MRQERVVIPKVSKLEQQLYEQMYWCSDIPPTEHWAAGVYGQAYVCADRKWQWDFCWPERMIAVEVQGGLYRRSGAKKCRACGQTPTGAHNTAKGYNRDVEKLNAAMILGYRFIIVTSDTLKSGQAVRDIAALFRLS